MTRSFYFVEIKTWDDVHIHQRGIYQTSLHSSQYFFKTKRSFLFSVNKRSFVLNENSFQASAVFAIFDNWNEKLTDKPSSITTDFIYLYGWCLKKTTIINSTYVCPMFTALFGLCNHVTLPWRRMLFTYGVHVCSDISLCNVHLGLKGESILK